jgi:hypothetical protein
MALASGSPYGSVIASEDITLESGPNIYFADVNTPYFFNPDSDGFYWQLSGTVTYPVYQIGCYEGVSFGDNLEVNAVRCDAVGDKDVIMKRNHLELQFTLKSFMPFTILSRVMNGGAVTINAARNTEEFGLGVINNNQYYKVYVPKVYDEAQGDYVAITGHRCKFVSQGAIQMNFGNAWQLPVTVWMFADEAKPSSQQFCTVVRADPSVL